MPFFKTWEVLDKLNFNLEKFEDFSYEEIAQIQHCQLGTIKSRLSRGRELLLKRLKLFDIKPEN